VEKTWPRTGILRVEIVHNSSENYSLVQSYEKEYNDLEVNVSEVLEGLEDFTLSEEDTTEPPDETLSEEDQSEDGSDDVEMLVIHQVEETNSLELDDLSNSTMKPHQFAEENLHKNHPFHETLTEIEMLARAGIV
jgi:exopolysaccharide biosynthesis predicted pyruvyltransferase EpsI